MKKKPSVDIPFLALTFLLVLFGTIMIFSASSVMGLKIGDSFYYLKRHMFYLFAGILAFAYAVNMDLQKIKKASFPFLCVTIIFLLMLFIPIFGKRMGGATRWLDLYIFSFQPAELVKISVVIFLATALSNLKDRLKDFVKGLLPLLLILVFIAAIIVKQPDLGTTISILATSFLMFFLAGAKISHLASLAGLGAIVVGLVSIFSAYRLKRLLAYLNPWKDPLNTGFQIIQSLLAVGSGGLFGLGLGNSRQKFYYLPQQYADFIFAVLCEELGFIGGTVLLMIFLAFFFRGYKIASSAPDEFSYLLASGLVSMLFVQTALNIMVVTGLVPTTGIPLPFVSYGGTAMIINMFSVGIIANVSRLKASKK